VKRIAILVRINPMKTSGVATLLATGAVLALSPPKPAIAQTQPSSQAKRIAIYDGLRYRSGENPAWQLDLAMPENFGAERRPALVIVHGGGWNAGTRRSRPYRRLLTEYALNGYVAISIDYRLLAEAPMGEIVEDVDCAVRWLRAHAEEYRVDPDRIGVFGHSAGAHLALMLGVSPPAPPVQGDCEWNEYSSRVTAIAGGSTPTQLPERFGDSERFSPATYPSAQIPPLLLIQGTADPIVRVGLVDEYVEKLKAAGATDVTYLRIEDGDHDVAYDDSMEPSLAAMSEFFERTLKP
jgi:acetyl esterase/lipase